MEIVFSNANFIYKETNYNIYGGSPVAVNALPEATESSPMIVNFLSHLYEKCVYLTNTSPSANMYFKRGNGTLNNVTITPSDDFVHVDSYTSHYSLRVDENKSSVGRYATVTVVSNTDSITFKLFQDRVNPLLIFTKTEEFKYKHPEDVSPVALPHIEQIGGIYFEHYFNTLLDKDSNKKEVLKVFCDKFLSKQDYIVSDTEKYMIDVDYDGNPVSIPSFTEYGSENSPQYITCDGKTYHKVMGLKNGKNTPVYEEGVLIDGSFYYKTNYDDPFRINFNTDGSLSITNYGRCFVEPKAFYVIKLSHKYSPTATGTIKIFYLD